MREKDIRGEQPSAPGTSPEVLREFVKNCLWGPDGEGSGLLGAEPAVDLLQFSGAGQFLRSRRVSDQRETLRFTSLALWSAALDDCNRRGRDCMSTGTPGAA